MKREMKRDRKRGERRNEEVEIGAGWVRKGQGPFLSVHREDPAPENPLRDSAEKGQSPQVWETGSTLGSLLSMAAGLLAFKGFQGTGVEPWERE